MPVLPHNFPALRQNGNVGHRRIVLMLGAGMSYDLVLGPGNLLAEKRQNAEAKLNCTAALPFSPTPPPEHLYEWANQIIDQLTARGDPNPKLALAQALDIPNDPLWRGDTSSQRNTPRHRVIARFARERVWDQIWSLNWDNIQESAFENVGIKRNGKDELLYWPTAFRSFVTARQCSEMGQPYDIKIFKPHGCVMALIEAEEASRNRDNIEAIELSKRFLITKTELENLARNNGDDGTQHFIFANLSAKLCSQPFITVGWRAMEGYLIDHIEATVRPALEDRYPLPDDELSIIDISFNGEGHTRLARFYDKVPATAHIPIDSCLTLDRLFLWLQALYATERLQRWVHDDDQDALTHIVGQLQQPPDDPNFVIEWVDNFLPVWARLCWKRGMVECYTRDNRLISTDNIHLESRDEHIPWSVPYLPSRPDLRSASRLLIALHRSGNGMKWNYEMFPGGLYQDYRLVIPLPVWKCETPNDLRGLKALIDSIKDLGDGYIAKIAVLFINPDPQEDISDTTKLTLKELVAKDLAIARFARGNDIGEVRMEEL